MHTTSCQIFILLHFIIPCFSYSPLCGGKYRYVEYAVIAYLYFTGADYHDIDGNSTIVCSTNEIFIFLEAPLKWQGIHYVHLLDFLVNCSDINGENIVSITSS